MPHQEINAQTGAKVVNETGPDLVVNSMQDINANDMARLGFQFLTAAYLAVNQDSNQFHLWEANPTSNQDIVGLDETGAEITTFCADTGATTATTTNPASSSTGTTTKSAIDSVQSTRLPAGTIAGAAVGAAVGGIVFAASCFWFWRRRKRQQPAAAHTGMIQSEQTHLSGSYSEAAYKPNGWCPPQELQSESAQLAPRHELAG